MTETDRLVEVGKLADNLTKKYVALRDIVARALEKQAGTDRLLLVADQWEELYTLSREEQASHRFLGEVLDATERGALSVVLTLRGDFFGHVLSDRRLADRLQGAVVNLGSMTREELEHAIEFPARKVGLTFEAGLVNRILDDVEKEPGSLPLMELVLTGLWEQRQGGHLHHDAYEAMGGVQGVLSQRAEEVFARLTPAQQESARRVFLLLIRPGEDTGDSRRRTTFTEVGEAVRPVVQQLADARLLVTRRDAATEQETIEVTHEALIHRWERLRGWLDNDREFLLWHQRLRGALTEWQRTGHDSGVLLRGATLTEAERWLAERSDRLTPAERGFLQESIALHEQETTALTRRRRIVKMVAVIFLFLAAAAGLGWIREGKQRQIAEQQRQVAEEQRRLALARQLGAQAELVRSQRADLLPRSMLLAVESMNRYPTLEGDHVLRSGLALLPRPRVHLGHETRAWTLAFSPDGKWLAAGSGDQTQTAWVWEVDTGQVVAKLEHERAVQLLTFSHEGRWLATGSGDRTRVWEVATWEEVAGTVHGGAILALAFSADGQWLMVASLKRVRMGSIAPGTEAAQRRSQLSLSALVINPDGQWLTPRRRDSMARLGEPLAGSELLSIPLDDYISNVAFSPNGKYFMMAPTSHQGTRMWEVMSGEKLTLPFKSRGAFAFSPDGERLAMWTPEGSVHVWVVGSDSVGAPLPCEACKGVVAYLAFSPDSQWLATATGGDTFVQVWDVAKKKEVARVVPGRGPVAFSPNGRLLAAWTGDNTITMWEIAPEPEMAQLGVEVASEPEMNEKIGISAVAIAPDGTWLAAGWGERTVQVWEAMTGRTLAQVKHPGGMELRVSLSPHGRWLATIDEHGTVQVWEVATEQRMPSIAPEGPVQTITFSPDGTRLAVVSGNRVRVQAVETGKRIAELPHEGQVWAIAFSPNGRRLATGSTDHTVRVWEVATRRVVAPVPHEDAGTVRAVAFSSDGKWLATGSSDKTARLWDAGTGRTLARMQHESDVEAVAVSPDGKWLVTASGGHGWRWLLRPQDLIDDACARLTRNLTPQEWQQYLGEEPYRKTCPALP